MWQLIPIVVGNRRLYKIRSHKIDGYEEQDEETKLRRTQDDESKRLHMYMQYLTSEAM